MSGQKLYGVADFPLADTAGQDLPGQRGRVLAELTLEGVQSGALGLEDFAITPMALLAQAGIARDAGRAMLAANFERAAELVAVPQEVIMELYELLRPGRASGAGQIRARAEEMRRDYGAVKLAEFLENAALHYQRRGLIGEGESGA